MARTKRKLAAAGLIAAAVLVGMPTGDASGEPLDPVGATISGPEYSKPAAFGVSRPVTELAREAAGRPVAIGQRPEEVGPQVVDKGFTGDAMAPSVPPGIDIPAPAPTLSCEGINNIAGVAPPDTVGDVGPANYVQMVNLQFAVFNKACGVVTPPTPLGNLFLGLPGVHKCEGNFGDPIVLHDQLANRWILTQFTAGAAPFFLCIAISQTANPAGAYFLYAFNTTNFPDYPKFGVWPQAYFASTREIGFGIGAYAFNRAQMLVGNPAAAMVKFLLAPGAEPWKGGDGLLPSDLDGRMLPPGANPINAFVGTMDSGGPYGAPFDGINLFHYKIDWVNPPSFTFIKSMAVVGFDSIYPCAPGPRDCLEQPGTAMKVDILSYRQRPMHRLAYRNFGSYQTVVTNQSIEAAASLAGIRWYEIRSPLTAGAFVFQQANHFGAGIHRWMGSIAQDKNGNMALGYSVSNAVNVFPGIRYVGRLAGDALNTMPWTERILINGAGSQTGIQRWGDYSSMNIDPSDDCNFWYTQEYHQVSSPSGWQTRYGRFRFPNC